jgi:SAM-dependent methyltransferase
MPCLICKHKLNLPSISFTDFPMYPSSVPPGALLKENGDSHTYHFAITHCPNCDLIQQKEIPDLKIVYAYEKNEGVGSKWERHYNVFSNFVFKNTELFNQCLEIGGGNSRVANKLLDRGLKDITICDVNAQIDPQFKSLSGFFENLTFKKTYDVIYLSHVFEHISDYHKHFEKVDSLLKTGGKYIISLPNFELWIKEFYLNAFIQEHIAYPFKGDIISLLKDYGLSLSDEWIFEDHSLMLCFEKKMVESTHTKKGDNGLTLASYKESLQELEVFLKSTLESFEGDLFIFGAHIFSQIVLSLDTFKNRNVSGILDNSTLKINKPLYHFDIPVFTPDHLKNIKTPCTVIIFAGAYEEEIVAQILEINPNIRLITTKQFKNEQTTVLLT